MKKKVMQFIHGLGMGGAECLVKEYCLTLDRSRFDLVLVCLERYGMPYEETLKKAGCRVIYVSDLLPEFLRKRTSGPVGILRKIGKHLLVHRIIACEKPDVIHSHLSINQYLLESRIPRTTRLFYTVHSDPYKLWNESRERTRDFNALVQLGKNHDLTFLVLHEQMRRQVNELFHITDSVIINNGIDFDRFDRARSRAEVRRELGILQDAVVIGHVGRFAYMKNHLYLADIFHEFRKKCDKGFLLMVGDGPMDQEVREKLDSMGHSGDYMILKHRTDVPDLMNSFDFFVFPSTYEGLPVSMVEAQKTGLRCLMSDTVTDDVVISNLVKKMSIAEKPEAWAEALLKFGSVQPQYTNLEEWDMKAVIRKLENMYAG